MRCYGLPDEAKKILLDDVQSNARGAARAADVLDKKGMYTERALWLLRWNVKQTLDAYKKARAMFEPDITIFDREQWDG